MEDADFRELFQQIVDRYELAPDVAAELLQRILWILKKAEDAPLRSEPNCEIPVKHPVKKKGKRIPGKEGENDHEKV